MISLMMILISLMYVIKELSEYVVLSDNFEGVGVFTVELLLNARSYSIWRCSIIFVKNTGTCLKRKKTP